MFKKRGAGSHNKKGEIVAPEVPTISLPPPAHHFEKENVAKNTDVADLKKKEKLRNKLFKPRSVDTNENEFSKSVPSDLVPKEESHGHFEEEKPIWTEQVENSNDNCGKKCNPIRVTPLHGGNTYVIDSTSGSDTFSEGVIFDELPPKNTPQYDKAFRSFDIFEKTLHEEIANRENAKTFTYRSVFPQESLVETGKSSDSHVSIQIENESLTEDITYSDHSGSHPSYHSSLTTHSDPEQILGIPDSSDDYTIHSAENREESNSEEPTDEVEEILGLDFEHENEVKFSSNPMIPGQRYQLYPDPTQFIQTSYASNDYSAKVTGGKPGTPVNAGSVPGSYNFYRSPALDSNLNYNCSQRKSASATASAGAVRSTWEGMNQFCVVQTCTQLASKKCKNCKAAFYCSEEHQRTDWKNHKHHCIPYKMEIIDDARSAMVAVRNIQAGRQIFSEQPFLVFPIASFETDFIHVMDLSCIIREDYLHTCQAKKPACLGCMRLVDLHAIQRHHCSKCDLPLCSKNCEDEIAHDLGECMVIRNSDKLTPEERPQGCFHSLYMDIEILRALQLEQYDRPLWEKFLEFHRHVRVEYYRKTNLFACFVQNTKRLVPYSVKASGYNLDLVRNVHAIITALSFKPNLKSPFKLLISTQLYFAHDCVPNTLQYIESEVTGTVYKMRCVVKAAVTILKGEIISLDFVPTPYLAYSLRRRVLENICLNCTCPRCVNPSITGDHSGDICCPNCRRGLVRPETALQWKDSIWSCNVCQEEVPYSQIKENSHDLRNQLYIIPKSREGLDKLYDFIQKAQRQLNPTHELVIMAWCFIEAIIRPHLESVRSPDPHKILSDEAISDYQLLSEYCDACEKHFKALRPGFWLDRGIVCYQKFYATFALASREFQENHLPRKEYINQLLRALKNLQDAVVILGAYDGYNAADSVSRLTHDATWTLSTVKNVISRFLQQESQARSTINSLA